jgi:hypothetical protein
MLELQRNALAFLITAYWLEGEAAAQGVSVPAAELQAGLSRLLAGPAGASFRAGLKRRSMSRADELLVLRLGALAQRLRAKLGAGGHAPLSRRARRRISSFITSYERRWKQRTVCRAGYVIAQCREGPPLPHGGA